MKDLYSRIIQSNSIVRQQILSFNEFLAKDISEILQANNTILSDIEPTFYLKYNKIYVGKPEILENMSARKIYPNECRIRDLTYSSPVFVDIEYKTKGQIIKKGSLHRKDSCNVKIQSL